jgi:cytochrome b involved in lipid metabolism
MSDENKQKISPRTFTSLAEIFQHNTKESLWIMIDRKVYDVTNFKHPGGKTPLLNNAGQDATT